MFYPPAGGTENDPNWSTASVVGTFDGLTYNVPLLDFSDLGEFDNIMLWENPIAIELDELPRFNHH